MYKALSKLIGVPDGILMDPPHGEYKLRVNLDMEYPNEGSRLTGQMPSKCIHVSE